MKRRGNGGKADGDKRAKRNSSILPSEGDTTQEGTSSHTTPGTTQQPDDNPAVRPSLALEQPEDSNDAAADFTHDSSACYLCKSKNVHGNKDEELWAAIKKDDPQAMVHWLAMGASATEKWHHRFSRAVVPAMIASEHNSARALRVLLKHGADANETIECADDTPLMVACRHNSVAVARVLLQHGADVHCSPGFDTALTIASKYASVEMVKMLIEHGAKVSDESLYVLPFFRACEANRVDIMKTLMEHGADVHQPDSMGQNALFKACAGNRIEAMRWLIDHGIDVHHRDKCNFTPLMFCTSRESVELLMRHGAEVNAEDDDQYTALMHACRAEESRLDVVTCLVELGADVNHVNKHGETPLMLAIEGSHLDIMEYLIEHGADVDMADNKGRTALMQACLDSWTYAVALLLRHGADVNAVDNDGRTPLILGATRSLRVTRLLLAHGANVHETSKDGWTALLHAAFYDKARIMRELLRHKADIMRELLRHGAALRHAGENALGRVVCQFISYNKVSTLRLLVRECHWRIAARSGYWLQEAVEKENSRACRLLAAAALVGRIG